MANMVKLVEMKINNFKAFGISQNIPLKPLTLVYGANSSGKSSMIHSLLFLNEVMSSNEVDVHYTNLGGESLDLGGFTKYIHNRNRESDITLELTYEWIKPYDQTDLVEMIGLDLNQFLRNSVNFSVGYVIGRHKFIQDLKHYTTLKPTLKEYWININNKRFFTAYLSKDTPSEIDSYGFEIELETITSNKDAFFKDFNKLIPRVNVDMTTEGFEDNIPLLKNLLSKSKYYHLDNIFLPESIIFHYTGDCDAIHKAMTEACIQNFLNSLAYVLKGTMESVKYLGPLRTYPDRFFLANYQSYHTKDSKGNSAWKMLMDDSKMRYEVNKWLKTISPNYYLEYVEYLSKDDIEHLLDNIICDDTMDHKQLKSKVNKALSSIAVDHSGLTLLDMSREISVSHRDIGVGISQVLPVLAECVASRNNLIIIEQPEIHLHPAIQADLSDMFIKYVVGMDDFGELFGNRLIIETHSEHLLLRIMRRMRETANGEHPSGDPFRLTPEDVSVLYVQPVGNRSIIQEIPLSTHGELLESWPGGFFEEDLKEIF